MKMLTKEDVLNLLSILATASITGVSLAITGTIVPEVMRDIGIHLSSNIIHSGGAKLKERWLYSNDGILNHDIQQALGRAFIKALTHMEREYFKLSEANALAKNEKESIKALFKELRENAQEVYPSLEKNIKEQEIKEYLYGGKEIATDKLWERINGTKILNTYNKHFVDFFRQNLLNEVQFWFTEELKTDSKECNKAWRAFQRLLLEGIQEDVKAVQASQDLIHQDLQTLGVLRNQIEQLKDTIDHRLPDEPFQGGLEKAISEMQVVLQQVARIAQRTEDKIDEIAKDVEKLSGKKSGITIPIIPRRALAELILPNNNKIKITDSEKEMIFGRDDFVGAIQADNFKFFIGRKHFKIINMKSGLFIKDLGSVNGTKLNGKNIKGARSKRLKDGDEIMVADVLKIKFIQNQI